MKWKFLQENQYTKDFKMYFAQFPLIFYDIKGNGKFKFATNLLRRVGMRTKVVQNLSLYDTYDVMEGETPESIADDVYGDAELHWIICLANDIIDRFHDWPMTTPQFLSFIDDKYTNPNGVHHYEISQTSGDTTVTIDIGTDNTDYPSATTVTNFEYEEKEQDKKRQIRIIRAQYLDQIINEFEAALNESVV